MKTVNNVIVFGDGACLLPNMQKYFYCNNDQILDYLKTLH